MENNTPITLHQQLRTRMENLHQEGHKLPYVVKILNDDVPLKSYVNHLRAFKIIYEALEKEINAMKNPELIKFFDNYRPKLDRIYSDLDYLGSDNLEEILPAKNKASQVADKISNAGKENPYKMLGILYTLEGSLNGGRMLKKHISRALKLSNDKGAEYLSSGEGDFKVFWEDFINKLNSGISDNQNKKSVIGAAEEIFHDIIQVYRELYPVNKE